MKKTFVIILAIALAIPCGAADKKSDKTKKEIEKSLPLVLSSPSDTLSYVAGVMQTNELLTYLEKSHGVKAADIEHFVMGLLEYYKTKGDAQKKAYNVGVAVGNQVETQMLQPMKKEFTNTPDSIIDDIVMRGFIDAILGNSSLYTVETASEKFQAMYTANKEAKDKLQYGENMKKGQEFLAANAQKEGVVVLPSGLQYKVLQEGDGARPRATDKVRVHYEGTLIDGTVFDASRNHSTEPISFKANEVIKGWTEALTMMKVGSKWQLFIPHELAYGSRQAGQIPPFSTLIFTVELIGVEIE